jgi:protoporphyrin/coproporphyrin ferrochelatase
VDDTRTLPSAANPGAQAILVGVSGKDAILFVSFGGPEAPEDVMPFLDNVLRGRNVPPARRADVAHHYEQFGGKSPINGQNRALIAALEAELSRHGPALPVFFGNRNWHPFLADTLGRMADAGVERAFAFVTSAFSSYSGCRQYREDIERAREAVGPRAPKVEKLRAFFNHPGFIEASVARLREALGTFPVERRAAIPIAFTAHSIPTAMASSCAYEAQLREACALVAEEAGVGSFGLAFQSRSGPPNQPWLEPDIGAHLAALAGQGHREVVVAPIGFLSDHMEVVYDLDTEAQAQARELGLRMLRAGTAGTHPAVVSMIRELVEERLRNAPRRALGTRGPLPDTCLSDCCLSGREGARPA